MDQEFRAAIETVLREAGRCRTDSNGFVHYFPADCLAVLRHVYEKYCRKYRLKR